MALSNQILFYMYCSVNIVIYHFQLFELQSANLNIDATWKKIMYQQIHADLEHYIFRRNIYNFNETHMLEDYCLQFEGHYIYGRNPLRL